MKPEYRDTKRLGSQTLGRLWADGLADCTTLPLPAGYYGTSDSESFSEASRPGGDYLAEVCRDWEDTADSAQVGLGQSCCHGLLLHGDGLTIAAAAASTCRPRRSGSVHVQQHGRLQLMPSCSGAKSRGASAQ